MLRALEEQVDPPQEPAVSIELLRELFSHFR
jgi:hypothetical protein